MSNYDAPSAQEEIPIPVPSQGGTYGAGRALEPAGPIAPDMFVSSRRTRDQHINRDEVLERVKALALLADDVHASVELVASFYEVGAEAIKSLVKDNRDELDSDGYDVITGRRLRAFKDLCGIESRARAVAVFPRRAILRVGMLLRDSDVARQVRTHLLDSNSQTPNLSDLDDLELFHQRFGEAIARAKAERLRAELAEKKVAVLTPRAAQADQHRAADGLVAVGDFANKVAAWALREHRIVIKHAEVWNFLSAIGLLIRGNTVRHNHPTSWAVQKDFIRLKESEYSTRTRGMQVSFTPRLTPKGEGWAWDRAVALIEQCGSLNSGPGAIGS